MEISKAAKRLKNFADCFLMCYMGIWDFGGENLKNLIREYCGNKKLLDMAISRNSYMLGYGAVVKFLFCDKRLSAHLSKITDEV